MRWWDVEPALQIERDLFPDPWTEGTFWSELAGVPETRYYVVAETGGRVVGYGGLFAAGHQADVQTLAVSGDCQRQVRADNDAAARLYERYGFDRIGVRRGYYQPGRVDAVVMRRRPPRTGTE
jgi:ribosomal-protein-alanine N-acetyltransferase